jgi:hypothetical protein
MNAKKLYLIIAAAALALVLAFALQRAQRPRTDTGADAKPLLPQLHDRINDVTAVTLTGGDAEVIATLKRGNEGWTVTEKSGYPADIAKIRELLLHLDEAALIEPKTTDPNRYAEIGVDDVKNQNARGVQVDIAGLTPPGSLIIGLPGGVGTFVRRSGEAQGWLASGDLSVSRKVTDWEKHSLMDLPSGRLKSITLTALDGKKVVIYKEHADDANFKLADVPKGREPGTPYVLNAVASALAGLKSDDVYTAKEMAPQDKTYTAQYAAFDGLVLTAIAWQVDGNGFVQFKATMDRAVADAQIDRDQTQAKAAYAASAAPASKQGAEDKSAGSAAARSETASAATPKPLAAADPVKDRQDKIAALNKEVDALNQTFSGWTFVVPVVRFNNFKKSMDDVLLPLPEKTPTAADAHAPAANVAVKPAAK